MSSIRDDEAVDLLEAPSETDSADICAPSTAQETHATMPAPSRSDQRSIQLGLIVLAVVFVWMAAMAWQRPMEFSEIADIAPWPDMRINVNTATEAELTVLPGIGPRLAERIVQDRDAKGPFASLDDLTRVHMIGPRTVESIRPHVFIKPTEVGSSAGSD